MAWSIFQQGGGDPAAVQWAHDLESMLGIQQSDANTQFIYDWEKSEGGGGKYNPLNQGPVPGHPELTTTGEQYGGGAADYASYGAGLQGAVDYLHMSNYTHVLSSLQAGDAAGARSALIASPWASSHYGGGANFSNAPVPNGTQQLTSAMTTPGGGGGLGGLAGDLAGLATGSGVGGTVPKPLSGIAGDVANGITGALSSLVTPLKVPFEHMAVRVALVAFGAVAVLVGVATLMRDGTSGAVDPIASLGSIGGSSGSSSGGSSGGSGDGSVGSTGKAPGVAGTARDTAKDVGETGRAAAVAA